MSWFKPSSRPRDRQRALYRPRFLEPLTGEDEPPATEAFPKVPDLVDWPAIQSRHPTWWQVHRIELEGTERRLVLIAECRSEEAAFTVAAQQAAQVRITRWGSKQRPYESFRPPLMRVVGTVRIEEQ